MHEYKRLNPQTGAQLPDPRCHPGSGITDGQQVQATGAGRSPTDPLTAPAALLEGQWLTDRGRQEPSPSGNEAADEPFTPAAVRRLSEQVVQGWIAPSDDGLGGYLVWIEFVRSRVPARVWRYLTHEDGAPLRFPDALGAHGKAVDCHVDPARVAVRWPPRPIRPDSSRPGLSPE